jgi:perosamine synthetase
MIPRFSPNYDLKALAQCVLPALPDAVNQLEKAFCKRTGHEYAIAFKYGRSGLYTLLQALGAKKKRVIMPSYTCVVVAHAVVLSGNTPYFLDNAPNHFQPEPNAYLEAVEKLEAEQPGQVAMVIPTHIFGIAEHTQPLYKHIKQAYPHVFVLQDCAHSYFAEDATGSCVTTWGDGALFGMNISKLVNSVRGGMLTLQDPTLAKTVQEFQAQASELPRLSKHSTWLNTLKARLYAFCAGLAFTPIGYEVVYWLIHHTRLLSSQTDYFQPETIDLPTDFRSPMLPFEASIGLSSLEQYNVRITQRRQLAAQYVEMLSTIKKTLPNPESLCFPEFQPGNTWSHFPVCVPAELRDTIRTQLETKLRAEIGIIVDYSVADLSAYRALGAVSTPLAAEMASSVINLPMGMFENRFGFNTHYQEVVRLLATIQAIFQKALSLSLH